MGSKWMLRALAIVALAAMAGAGTAIQEGASRDTAVPDERLGHDGAPGRRQPIEALDEVGQAGEVGEIGGVTADPGRGLELTAAGSGEIGDDERVRFDPQAGDELGATQSAIEASRRISLRAGVSPDPPASLGEPAVRAASAEVAAAILCAGSGSECRSNADCCSGLACAGGVAGYGTAGFCAAAR